VYSLALTQNSFEGIYQEPPDWCVTPTGFRTFSPYAFTHSLNSVTSNLSSVMFSAPRSSGAAVAVLEEVVFLEVASEAAVAGVGSPKKIVMHQA